MPSGYPSTFSTNRTQPANFRGFLIFLILMSWFVKAMGFSPRPSKYWKYSFFWISGPFLPEYIARKNASSGLLPLAIVLNDFSFIHNITPAPSMLAYPPFFCEKGHQPQEMAVQAWNAWFLAYFLSETKKIRVLYHNHWCGIYHLDLLPSILRIFIFRYFFQSILKEDSPVNRGISFLIFY